MKKKYNFITALFFCFGALVKAQNPTMTFETSNNGDWSETSNWTPNGIPGTTDIVDIKRNINLDVDATVMGMVITGSRTISTSNGSSLVVDVNSSSNSTNGFKVTGDPSVIDIPLVINNSATDAGRTRLFVSGGPKTFQLGSNSSITVSTDFELDPQDVTNTIEVNGLLLGQAALRLGDGTTTFSATSNNTGFEGSIQTLADANVVVNTALTGGFLHNTAQKLQINGNSTVTLNTTDVLQGSVNLGDGNNLTLNVNANQPNIRDLGFAGTGDITINIDNSVTNLSFGNSASVEWGTGNLNITGFQQGVVRFGSDDSGLTPEQLSAITADGVASGMELGLDSSGYLVLASTLSIDGEKSESLKRVSFPSIVDAKISFTEVQQNVKIANVNGQIILEKNRAKDLDVSNLSSGLYFLLLQGKRVEKFVKN